MNFSEDFFHWLVIFFVRPQRQTKRLFVNRMVIVEKIGNALVHAFLAVAFSLLLTSISAADQPREQGFNIPQQSVQSALNSLASQANMLLLFPYDDVIEVDANPVMGTYSIQHALNILLHNTGLKGDLTEGGVIAISQAGIGASSITDISKGKSMNTNKRKSLLATMVGLMAAGGLSTAAAQDLVGESARAQTVLDEIIITATKRETNLQETAGSIAAIGQQEIDRRGLAGMEDYLATVPGVSFLDRGVGQNSFIIRGVSSDPQSEAQRTGPSVGLYFGEVPLAGLGISGGGANPRLVDMNRVEVLRGPQGTLFGAGSLTGAIRNIPNSPNLEKVEGGLKLGYSNTSGNGSSNNTLEGVINIPIIQDVLAIRAVAYKHDMSGYMMNQAASDSAYAATLTSFGSTPLDQEDMGSVEYTGGRVSILWKPVEEFSANLTYIDQQADQNGSPDAQLNSALFTQLRPSFGDVAVSSPLKGETFNIGDNERLEEDLSITNLVLQYDFESVSLLTSSSWVDQENLLARSLAFFPSPVAQLVPFKSDYSAHEVRLVSNFDGPFQYLMGVYYEEFDRDSPIYIAFTGDNASNPFGFPLGVGNALFSDEFVATSLKQDAFFAELSYDINDQLELTLGGRRYDYERERLYLVTGLFGDNLADGGSQSGFSESGSTYKAKLAYQMSDDNLLYAQWSEGFRPGSTNSPAPASICDTNNDGVLDGTNVPIRDFFDSDTLESYELGIKSTSLNGRFRVNAAIYQNNWEGIPIAVQSPTCLFSQVGNAGEAETKGIEVETIFNVNDALQLILGGSYVDAALSSEAPSLGGASGDRLPGSPEHSLNVGFQYDFELASSPSYLRVDYAHMGGFYNNLSQLGAEIGDYGKLDIKAGVSFDNFDVELFAKNLTNDHAITWLGSFLPDSRVNRLRPRTIGLNVGYQF